MDYLYDYLVFLAQAVTVVVAILLILSAMASLGMKRQQQGGAGHLEIRKLNDRLSNLKDSLRQAVLPQAQFKKLHKQDQKKEKADQKQAAKKAKSADPDDRARIFVLHFEGDIQASKVDQLRTEVTAVLTLARWS